MAFLFTIFLLINLIVSIRAAKQITNNIGTPKIGGYSLFPNTSSTPPPLEDSPLSVFATTWNMNGADGSKLEDELLEKFLFPLDNNARCPDVFILSTQEQRIVAPTVLRTREKTLEGYHNAWVAKVHRFLCNKCGQKKILHADVFVGAVSLMVFSTEYAMKVHGKDKVARGINPLGRARGGSNKGFASVRFTHPKMGSTPIIAVAAHLAANEGQIQARSDDLTAITNQLREWAKEMENGVAEPVTFLLGDLNFRLVNTEEIDNPCRPTRVELVVEQNYTKFLPCDEWKEHQPKMLFLEPKIDFPPTYKVKKRDNWLLFDVKRAPAWTDRVLLKHNTSKVKIYVIEYKSNIDFTKSKHFKSDHVPVYLDCTVEELSRDRKDNADGIAADASIKDNNGNAEDSLGSESTTSGRSLSGIGGSGDGITADASTDDKGEHGGSTESESAKNDNIGLSSIGGSGGGSSMLEQDDAQVNTSTPPPHFWQNARVLREHVPNDGVAVH
eukprot:GEMP01022799.1.p1 GENE.GEMP01022799.1~~GEMP01022799.1.p1  ORF type:complete len:499 (+),score=86.04 GEMP01022799.1:371-1867(+)